MVIPKAWLTRPTTFREFTARFLADEDGRLPASLLPKIEEREAAIAARLRPGDELWEFEHGERPLAMTWGLAIVRAGEVAEAWTEWES